MTNSPERLRRALEGQLYLFGPTGVHAESFEIEPLVVGFDGDGLMV
jgi:hypothetical protein